MSYHNTTGLVEPTLTVRIDRANRQSDEVFDIFRQYGDLDPAMCHAIYRSRHIRGKNVPLTSIRRAISDLTREGKLVKTQEKVIGLYGELNHVWRISPNN